MFKRSMSSVVFDMNQVADMAGNLSGERKFLFHILTDRTYYYYYYFFFAS